MDLSRSPILFLILTGLAQSGLAVNNPCDPNPCGLNTICLLQTAHVISCNCLPGYQVRGSSFDGCFKDRQTFLEDLDPSDYFQNDDEEDNETEGSQDERKKVRNVVKKEISTDPPATLLRAASMTTSSPRDSVTTTTYNSRFVHQDNRPTILPALVSNGNRRDTTTRSPASEERKPQVFTTREPALIIGFSEEGEEISLEIGGNRNPASANQDEAYNTSGNIVRGSTLLGADGTERNSNRNSGQSLSGPNRPNVFQAGRNSAEIFADERRNSDSLEDSARNPIELTVSTEDRRIFGVAGNSNRNSGIGRPDDVRNSAVNRSSAVNRNSPVNRNSASVRNTADRNPLFQETPFRNINSPRRKQMSEAELRQFFTEECLVNEDCTDSDYCNPEEEKCRPACSLNICGEASLCKSALNRPVCYCPDGFQGNPYEKCTKSPSRAGLRFKRR